MHSTLLGTAYWPNIQYFYYVLNSENVFIESNEHYQKQSFRNRMQILTANGVLDLSIPVQNKSDKQLIDTVEISYKEPWQIKHWRAITSAYKNSPYFDFFEEEIKDFYVTKPQYLFEYNLEQLNLLLKILRVKKTIHKTTTYQGEVNETLDLRNSIHPKGDPEKNTGALNVLKKPYYQTFQNKHPFVPNLSMLDLLFNKGLESLDYLKRS